MRCAAATPPCRSDLNSSSTRSIVAEPARQRAPCDGTQPRSPAVPQTAGSLPAIAGPLKMTRQARASSYWSTAWVSMSADTTTLPTRSPPKGLWCTDTTIEDTARPWPPPTNPATLDPHGWRALVEDLNLVVTQARSDHPGPAGRHGRPQHGFVCRSTVSAGPRRQRGRGRAHRNRGRRPSGTGLGPLRRSGAVRLQCRVPPRANGFRLALPRRVDRRRLYR